MAFKVLRFLKVGRYLKKIITDEAAVQKRRLWQGISHGFHVIQRGDEAEDLVLAQRELVDGLELWLFGAFDKNMGYAMRKYLQSNIFSTKFSEKPTTERRASNIMKNSYLITREQMHRGEKYETGGFTTALVMNGEKLVVANFGGYKAVLCKDGMGIQIGRVHRRIKDGYRSLIGMFRMKCLTYNGKKTQKDSKLRVITRKVEPEFEFIILASDGVWEVMSNQEAVDLISHIDDAQSAAEILAEEAVTRMSKSSISCAVIRFH